jgi:hypothetical protein
MAVWLAGLLLTDLGQILEELGDGGRVLLDPRHLAPLLDQNLRLFRHVQNKFQSLRFSATYITLAYSGNVRPECVCTLQRFHGEKKSKYFQRDNMMSMHLERRRNRLVDLDDLRLEIRLLLLELAIDPLLHR